MEAWETTPRLAFLSAEPGSGKSLAMRLVALLCHLALEASSATTASLIRALDDPDGRPTFFIDEIDTKYGKQGKGDEELRGLINAGHQIDGYILRNDKDGDEWYPVRKNVFSAMAMAGIGNILPDTVKTRSIVVKMRKRLPDEKVASYRRRDHQNLGYALRDELAAWADQIREKAALCRPTLPDEIADRDADVWEPLIVVADLAGGSWPDRARQAAIEAVRSGKVNSKPSLGVRLLTDIWSYMGDKTGLPTTELLNKLLADEEAPWGDLGYHKKLDARILAEMLDEYGIRPRQYRFNEQDRKMLRGYVREDFADAWARHLPTSVTGVTSVTEDEDPEETMISDGMGEGSPNPCDGKSRSVTEPES